LILNAKKYFIQTKEEPILDVVYKKIDVPRWNMFKRAGFSLSVVEIPNEPISYLAIGLYK
jgi:hypothetical protein